MTNGLDALLDEFLSEEFDESPVLASMLGVPGHDDRLGDLSAEGFERRNRRGDRWIGRLDAFPVDGLTPDEAIDRDLALSALRGRAVMRDWMVWRRNPDAYLGPGLTGVFTLFLNRLRPEPELAESAAARLRAVPDVLAEGKANLDADLVSPLFVQRAQGQCQAAVRYSRELVPAEVSDGESRRRLAEAGDVAAGAYEDFGRFLEALAEKAVGSHAVGEHRYSALLTQRELLGFDASELQRRGQAAYDALSVEMSDLASRIPDGDGDWHAAVAELNRDHPGTPDEMRNAYEHWTERARAFLRERQLVTLPDGEECLVVPSPHFQRPVLAVASYSAPPAFSPSLTGHFFVPYPPDDTPADEVQKRLETNNHASIPTISAHEAYPGHHWHLATAKAGARPVRKVLGTSYFVEGWALYGELMMREQGFFPDPRQELGHLDARIFRAARIVVDTSLHCGGMSVDDAVTFMREKTSMSEPTARAEVARYCAWPTQASSYLTGSMEIERLRDRFLGEGAGDLRDFHDRLGASGMLPLGLAERALFKTNGR